MTDEELAARYAANEKLITKCEARAMGGHPDGVRQSSEWREVADALILTNALIAALLSALDSMRERVGRLEAALRPFAKRAEYFDGKLKADGSKWEDADSYADESPSEIYLGDLRRAAEAIEEGKG